MERPTSMLAVKKILPPNSPNSFPPSGLKEGDKTGQLTERKNMDMVFIENKHILANQPLKTNEAIRSEKDEMIREFEIMVEKRHNELETKPIVFANDDFAIALVGKCGGCLQFSDGSAYLDIPAEALLEDRIIYMYKLKQPEYTGLADDQRKIYNYSKPIACGPEGTHFNKRATLNFEHCAGLDDNKGSRELTVFRRKNKYFPWAKQEQTRKGITANRVQHLLENFSERVLGHEGNDSMAPPRLRMCLMVVASRLRRHYVEVILMRYDSSIINGITDDFINVRGFEQNEVHLIRVFSIEPSQRVSFEGASGNWEISPDDWNSLGFYSFIMPTARTGCVELRLRQPNEEAPICAISIKGQGDVISELDHARPGQVDVASLSYKHLATQAEDTVGGRKLIRLQQCPDFAQPFAQRYSLETIDGEVQPREGEAIYPPEAADENPPPVEEMIAEVTDRDEPTYVQSSDVHTAETEYDLPRESPIGQDLPATAAAPNHPGLQYGHVDTEMSDGHEDAQSPNLVTTSTTEETLSALPVRDRVARRLLISSSSLRSDDGV